MNMNAFNAQMQQLAFWGMLSEAIAFVVVCWVMYWVTKSAIRDGIKESGLIEALRASPPPKRSLRDVLTANNDTRPMDNIRAD